MYWPKPDIVQMLHCLFATYRAYSAPPLTTYFYAEYQKILHKITFITPYKSELFDIWFLI